MIPVLLPVSAALIFAVFVGLVTYCIRLHNGLVADVQITNNSFAQIEVQLKRRLDLIPNLVEAVRGYMKHESETLDAVIQARSGAANSMPTGAPATATDPAAMSQMAAAQAQLSGALGRFSMVIESYPELKADQSVQTLMEELTSTENRISFARQLYNEQVTSFNIRRGQFPANFVAPLVGYAKDLIPLAFEESTAELNAAPEISLA